MQIAKIFPRVIIAKAGKNIKKDTIQDGNGEGYILGGSIDCYYFSYDTMPFTFSDGEGLGCGNGCSYGKYYRDRSGKGNGYGEGYNYSGYQDRGTRKVFKLEHRFANKLIDTFELDQNVTHIGRSPKCDVSIDSLGVSRFHAIIEKQKNGYILKDNRSNGGTFVLGERIQSYKLKNYDVFYFGKHSLCFIDKTKPQQYEN